MFERTLVAGALAVSLSACARKPPEPPAFDPPGQAKCGVVKSQSEPLVVEWPSAARGKLEALARESMVAVRYEGCDMEVLSQCRVPQAKYAYHPITRKHDRVAIKNADELYANVPIGAARLEGKLASAGELDVEMTLIGRWEGPSVKREALAGDCARATHVVTALTTGAFRFYAGAESQQGGGAAVLGVGAGAKTSSSRELLAEDGDDAACAKTGPGDSSPPFGCGAIVRLEVVPLDQPRQAQPSCPPNTTWDGHQCMGRVAQSPPVAPPPTSGPPPPPATFAPPKIEPKVYWDPEAAQRAVQAVSIDPCGGKSLGFFRLSVTFSPQTGGVVKVEVTDGAPNPGFVFQGSEEQAKCLHAAYSSLRVATWKDAAWYSVGDELVFIDHNDPRGHKPHAQANHQRP
jgi:hypothetical protein